MKILCVIDSLGSGGAQRQLVNLAVGFKEKGHDVSFLVYHSINFFKSSLVEHEIPVKEIIEPNYLKRLFKMRRFIRRGKYDSVFSFLEASNFICEISGLPWRKWKLVVGERSANPAILKTFKLRAFRWFHVFADYIVANSYENLKIVQKINPLLSSRKCHVIYNIVDFEKWQIISQSKHYENSEFRIVVAASHRYLKNLSGLVEAVNLLPPQKKNRLRIDWYGNNTHDTSRIEVQKKIKEYKLKDVFTFLEPILSIQQKMQEADAVGLFSFYEGLPNVICEAMAIGKPIIATAVSDIPLLISNKNLLSNPHDPSSISQSLKYLLTMKSDELINEGRINQEIALHIFNKETICELYLSLLTHV
ncbi:MAG: glycosyltransferase [Lentimicrobium sp.]|jgi:glycosyltransferase involved in cell wall biosynthesis|nr:glycosyltransferase [Lentimicrobium sp.]